MYSASGYNAVASIAAKNEPIPQKLMFSWAKKVL